HIREDDGTERPGSESGPAEPSDGVPHVHNNCCRRNDHASNSKPICWTRLLSNPRTELRAERLPARGSRPWMHLRTKPKANQEVKPSASQRALPRVNWAAPASHTTKALVRIAISAESVSKTIRRPSNFHQGSTSTPRSRKRKPGQRAKA